MTTQDSNKVASMVQAISPVVGDLYCRWQSEKKYEAIGDYGKVISKQLPKGFKLAQMTGKPFGFRFSYKGLMFAAQVKGRSIQLYSLQ